MNNLIGFVGHAALVGNHHDGHALLLVQSFQQFHHLYRSLRVESARRLVGQDNLRTRNQRPGNGHPLALSAREFVGVVLGPVFQSQPLQVFHGLLAALAAAHALIEQRQFHILHGRLESDEVEALEDKTNHVVTVFGGLCLAQVLYQRACQPVFTLVVVVENAQNVQQR